MPRNTDDLDDICGPVITPKPKKSTAERSQLPFEPAPLPPKSDFWKPVSRDFLAQVFEMDSRTISRRLARLEPVAYANHDKERPLYDFKQAAAYLIKPAFSVAEYIKSLRVVDLPAHLSFPVNQAMLARQKFDIIAKNLWRTEDVQSALGKVFMVLKDNLQLLPETIRDACPDLKDDHIERIRQVTDDTQKKMHEALCEMPLKSQTFNSYFDPDSNPLLEADDEDDYEL